MSEAAFLHLIIRRHLEQRTHRLVALDVRQAVDVLTHARVAVLAHHDRLQLRRVPALGNDFDGAVIAEFRGHSRTIEGEIVPGLKSRSAGLAGAKP